MTSIILVAGVAIPLSYLSCSFLRDYFQVTSTKGITILVVVCSIVSSAIGNGILYLLENVLP